MFDLCTMQVAEPGSVAYNFTYCGCIVVDNTTEDAIFEAAMEAGADDIQPAPAEDDGQASTSYRVFTSVEMFSKAQAKLAELGFQVNQEDSELVYKANTPVEVGVAPPAPRSLCCDMMCPIVLQCVVQCCR